MPGVSRVTLHTDRLTLRPVGRADGAWLHRHWNRPEVGRYLWDGEAVGQDTVEGAIAQSDADFAEHGWGLWLVVRRESGQPVGFAGLRTVPGHELVEVLYSLEPEHWGAGLATEAARAVLEQGWSTGLDHIAGGIDAPNDASRRVLQRLGMRPLGVLVVEGTPAEYHVAGRPA